MNQIEKIFEDSKSPAEFARAYLKYISTLLSQLDPTTISDFIETLESARERNARIFFIGNGGSAATSSHFANDLGYGTRSWQKPFRALSLTDNVAVLTAIGNDYGYEDVFILQLKNQLQAGDVVVAISASGNSLNLIKAVEYANENGAVTYGLVGFDGGNLSRLTKKVIHIKTAKGEYGPVEDLHMILDHLIGAYLFMKCRKEG